MLQNLQYPTWVDLDKFQRKPTGLVRFSRRIREDKGVQVFISAHMQPNITSNRYKSVAPEVSCTFKSFPGSYFRIYHVYACVLDYLVVLIWR